LADVAAHVEERWKAALAPLCGTDALGATHLVVASPSFVGRAVRVCRDARARAGAEPLADGRIGMRPGTVGHIVATAAHLPTEALAPPGAAPGGTAPADARDGAGGPAVGGRRGRAVGRRTRVEYPRRNRRVDRSLARSPRLEAVVPRAHGLRREHQ